MCSSDLRSGLGASPTLLGLILDLLAVTAVGFAMGLTPGEWRSLGRGMGQGVGQSAGLLLRGAARLRGGAAEEPPEPTLRARPRREAPVLDRDLEADDAVNADAPVVRRLRGELKAERRLPEAAPRPREEPRI